MEPLVGNFLQPLPYLTIYVSQVGEGAQRPEILAQVSDAGALDLAFLPGRGHMAGTRQETELTGKSQKARMKPHQVAFVFRHGRSEIVVDQVARNATQGLERVHVAPQECFETLAV